VLLGQTSQLSCLHCPHLRDGKYLLIQNGEEESFLLPSAASIAGTIALEFTAKVPVCVSIQAEGAELLNLLCELCRTCSEWFSKQLTFGRRVAIVSSPPRS
jgi:hypothetical protein